MKNTMKVRHPNRHGQDIVREWIADMKTSRGQDDDFGIHVSGEA
jgi:hypothetical protein